MHERDPIEIYPERASQFASMQLGLDVEFVETTPPDQEVASELRGLLEERSKIEQRIRQIVGLPDTKQAIRAAHELIRAAETEVNIRRPEEPTPLYPDDRNPSVSIWTASAGLPSHGKRR